MKKSKIQTQTQKDNLKFKITNLLNIYIHRKHILMTSLMISLRSQLKKKGYLTLNQFLSISKFLILDLKQFQNIEEMTNYFSPIIKDIPNYEEPKPSLEQFFSNEDDNEITSFQKLKYSTININNPPPSEQLSIKQLWSNI